MEREVLFAQTLEKVRKTAKEQGNCISEEQVKEAFASLELDGEQLKLVFDYLTSHKIGIGEPVDPDTYLSGEEKDYLREYQEEIEKLPKLTDGEKEALTLSAMAGDKSAQKRLSEAYLSDVIGIARLYAGQGVSMEDLIGEGNMALAVGTGMLGCLEKPSETQGMLGRMIMDAMENAIEENHTNRKIDKSIVDRINKVMERAKELAEDLQRKVTPEELARETGMSPDSVMEAIRMSGFQIEYIEVRRDA